MKNEKSNDPPFEVGDMVTSAFFPDAPQLVRKVTSVVMATNTGSGWLVKADGGGVCSCCQRVFSSPIVGMDNMGVDSRWFKKAIQQ